MMRTTCAALILVGASAAAAHAAGDAGVKVTHRHLVPVCMGGAPVTSGHRAWKVADVPVTMTFTMKNAPRPGIEDQAPGYATVTFTPVAGHRYEIEVRADATTFSRRVWPEGRWAPQIHDRTVDTVLAVSPTWGPAQCGAPKLAGATRLTDAAVRPPLTSRGARRHR